MSTLRDRIEKRLRDEICVLYTRDSRGGVPQECRPLFNHLDEVIEVIASVRDYSLDPYREKIREIVCASCAQDASGTCKTRAEERCALDKDFPRIVAIFEEEFKREQEA